MFTEMYPPALIRGKAPYKPLSTTKTHTYISTVAIRFLTALLLLRLLHVLVARLALTHHVVEEDQATQW